MSDERSLVFAVPGDPAQRTGGYLYDHHLLSALRAGGLTVQSLRLPGGFPSPGPDERARAAAMLADLPEHTTLLIDGMAFSVMPEIMAREAQRLRILALIHHPLAYETGLSPVNVAALKASERAALKFAHKIVVTSPVTRDALVADFDVPATRIQVALPGTTPSPLSTGGPGPYLSLLAVGSVIPRKNFPNLIRAMGRLGDLDWRLNLVGSMIRDPVEVGQLREALGNLGTLGGRVALLGELDGDSLARVYASSDLFVSSSLYEGFGMAVAEAIACGLPVVAVRAGAIGNWLSPDAACMIDSGDVDALASALRRTIGDPIMRLRLQAGSRIARQALRDWPTTAAEVAALLEDKG
ncbi:Glycosyl transferase 4-like domain-containing protein [Arboricoccus pini]|uniref:Glycosyl transferase 4-like domain-containing protein n=1 Tax=Arboricoccus pini TaxID=1963835 RepID=A0A212Q777_9PROT|nr:glycosyltransferase family 4 protein [Arboricoccus pini]SNB55187.1 Glycosyl transferase 4-like domain-containing protein [Arboricoccus pini]